MLVMDIPNQSEVSNSGPFVVEELISTVESTEPSVFINMMCIAPLPLPPWSPPFAPTAMSLTPSAFKSPMLVTDSPK